ncbi:O-antigen ligase family protein [Pedobacter sandarakinus]|uniref:O-antigen ligase family protein n=1 Tax=Pedobacter sandarakinus TaxID=353156 RepID=UPI002247C6BA|nr:O-antigen ligase family protein [Pedobacter sandarakinus]MCX2574300.1 O-antigen ligase family protein [Pedobacter sandarakinus]
MINRLTLLFLLFMFIYVTTFNIFMTGIFRIPAPVVFLAPLIYFYRELPAKFTYGRALVIFFIAGFVFYAAAQSEIASFFSLMIVVSSYALYFNFVVGNNIQRLRISVSIFISLLVFSGIIMLVDHQVNVAPIRSLLVMDDVLQAPSGISVTIFTFGYQMAAVTPFIVVAALIFKRNWLVVLAASGLAGAFIFLGMQRSVLVAFGVAVGAFVLFYYRGKSILIAGAFALMFIMVQGTVEQFSEGKNNKNILNKNVENAKGKEERGDLMGENLEIISNYPLGLMFYNKTWNDVVQHNYVYKKGPIVITSHNAYLMFITYLGPLLAFILLLLLYFKVGKIIIHAFLNIRAENNALLACLSVAFVSISVNSLFHNEWLLAVSGPTLFLYFSILQLAKIQDHERITSEENQVSTSIS